MAGILNMPPEIIVEIYEHLYHKDIINFSATCKYIRDYRNLQLIKHIILLKRVCGEIKKIEYEINHNKSRRKYPGWKCKYKYLRMDFPLACCLSFESKRVCSQLPSRQCNKSDINNAVFMNGHSYHSNWKSTRISYGSIGTFVLNINFGKVLDDDDE